MTLLNLNSYTLAVKKDMVISKKDLKKMPQMLPHWKPPGKNGLQGYWIKAFKYFQDQPLNFLTLCLQSGNGWSGEMHYLKQSPTHYMSAKHMENINRNNF